MPAGARCTPGVFTRPDTEKLRSPLRPRRPSPAKAAPAASSGIQYRVSTLFTSVGRPKRPTAATKGGRWRGLPGLPSSDSISADSSPQM